MITINFKLDRRRKLTGKIFTIPGYEEISLMAEKQYSGWMIFEVKTGLAVCPYRVFKTKTAAVNATIANFEKYGKEKILGLIKNTAHINHLTN